MSDTEFLNPLEFLGDRTAFGSHKAIILGGSRMEAGHQRDHPMTGTWEFSALPLLLQTGEWGWNAVSYPSFLCSETSMNIPEERDSDSLQIGEHSHTPGGLCPPASQGHELPSSRLF